MTKEIEWQKHINAWKESGLSQAKYCRKHGLNVHTLSYWRSRLLKAQAPGEFVELGSAKRIDPFEVLLAGGVVVKIPASFDSDALTRLIALLQ